MKKEDIQSVIVGSAITKSENMVEELMKFKEGSKMRLIEEIMNEIVKLWII